MKWIQKATGLTVAGALLLGGLTGCTTPKADDSAKDMVYEVAGIAGDTPIMTIDGEEVTAEQYVFWMLYVMNYQFGTAAEIDWEQDAGETSLREYVKEQALDMTKLFAVVEQKALAAGITLTDEQVAEADAQFEEQVAAMEAQGTTMADYLASLCVTEATYRKLMNITYLPETHQQMMQEEGGEAMYPGDINVYIDEQGYYYVKHILIKFDSDDEDSKAAALAQAQELIAQLKSAEDLDASFDQLMEQYSEDRDYLGALNGPDGYLAASGQMVAPFEEASLALDIGAITEEPVEYDVSGHYSGYHIIYRLDEHAEQAQAMAQEQYTETYLSTYMETWLADAEVVTNAAYDALDPETIYNNLTAIEAEKAAQESAVPSVEPSVEPTADPAAEPSPEPEASAPADE